MTLNSGDLAPDFSLPDAEEAIAVEDLAVKNMVKNPNLARAISDRGWGTFQTIGDLKNLWAKNLWA
jgi:hypothetical protein